MKKNSKPFHTRILLLFMVVFTLFTLFQGCSENETDSDNTPDETELHDVAETQDDKTPDDDNIIEPDDGPMFNMRYCEILLAQLDSDKINAEVWGTQGVNLCPQELWEVLDEETIATEYGAIQAIMNGPRYFVVDYSTGELPAHDKENRFYGELEMQYLTSVTIPLSQASDNSSYKVAEVDRSNVWHYNAGRMIYELTDPDGKKYIMQAYSQIVDDSLKLEDLENLGERLELPEGWSFSTRILKEDFAAENPDGVARVVQDELANTYQLIP